MKILSLFSGIGAFECALKKCGMPFEIAAFCEVDKYAAAAYSAIHKESLSKNLGDIRAADCANFENIDLVSYGFPCQDISCAGKQKGFAHNGERTRSGLFFDAVRIIRECRPKIAIAENVKALTSKKFTSEFNIVLSELSAAGYVNYWAVLNAKDYNLPQNRERVFIVSIRKDIDRGFEFPAPVSLKKRLADVLERDVPESYYLRETERTREIIAKYAASVTKNQNIELRQIGKLKDGNYGSCGSIQDRVYSADGIAPTLNTGSTTNPRIVDPNVGHHPLSKRLEFDGFKSDISPCLIATDYKAPKCTLTELPPIICASRGRNPEDPSDRTPGIKLEQRFEINSDGVSNTLSTVQKDNYLLDNLRIRKLTPRECWRLQGFSDADFDKAQNAGISKTQLYKQAGNSIAVDILCAIFEKLKKYF